MTTSANYEHERGLLSAIIQGVDATVAFQQLTAKDFFHTLNRRFFACLKNMVEAGEPLLLPTIQEKMKLDGEEAARLADLLDPLLLVRKESDIAGYIAAIRRDSKMRDVRRLCGKVVEANGDATGLILDLQGKAADYIAALQENTEAPGVLASTIKPQVVEWFWPARIPLGKITVIDGDPDRGKSLLTTDLIGRCTSGEPMPDGAIGTMGGAVLLNAEDDEADTIVPRLLAAGADVKRVRILKTLRTRDGERQIELPADIPAIREAALSVGAVFIVVDPLMAFLPDRTNSWRDQDIRRALAPLAKFAAELRVAVVIVRHLNKSTSDGNPLYRGGGSIGIIGAARAGLVVGEDPDDQTGETRILAVSKSNLSRKAASLRYRITPFASSVVVTWLGESEHRASTLLTSPEGEQRSAVDECRRFIEGHLADGARPGAEVIKAARAAGFSERNIDRAKVRAHVETYRTGFGKDGQWMWNLPEKGLSI